MDIDQLKGLSKTETFDFIRRSLLPEGEQDLSKHYRFNMSGYESKTGECTVHNQFVLNKFAFLGIYDYTDFLFLDFYKGAPTLYFRYWCDDILNEVDYSGEGTTSIIYDIMMLTIFSGKSTRRRN
jgi:hypothetical protein